MRLMTLTNYTDAATANAIAGLWDNAFDLSLTSNTMTAAFQIVVWELITDGLASANLDQWELLAGRLLKPCSIQRTPG